MPPHGWISSSGAAHVPNGGGAAVDGGGTEMAQTKVRGQQLVAAAVALLALAVSGCAARTATPVVSRNTDGSVAIDASRLRPVYDGRYVTADQLEELQRQGKATAGVTNRELACQQITLYVDTQAQAQAVQDDLERRHPMATLATAAPGDVSDPCAPFADSPRFVTSEG